MEVLMEFMARNEHSAEFTPTLAANDEQQTPLSGRL